MKFGAYLLNKGKIKGSDLANALKSQTDDFAIFGDIAINAEVLTKEQVTAIMDIQMTQGGFFGDIAVKLGFLNKGEIENRLGIHDRKRYLIGEKLVYYGAISKEEMEVELKQFQDWSTSRKIMKGYLDR
jgi:hypothetical protein